MVLNAKVTVVMPCFNGERFLREAIESVLAQSVQDFALIVVDDGSTDQSASIVESYAGIDQRVLLIRNRNGGPSAARNTGVEASATAFVAFLDCDDIWQPNHLHTTLETLEGDPSLGACFGLCAYINETGAFTGAGNRPFTGNVTMRDILKGNPAATCSALAVRRSAFDAAGPFRTGMSYAEDQEWLFRIISTGWFVRSSCARTVCYRTTPNGLSSQILKMQSGWEHFVSVAHGIAPGDVEQNLPEATASMNLYWARRAVADGQQKPIVARHLLAALRASPMVCGRAIAAAIARLAVDRRRVTAARTTERFGV